MGEALRIPGLDEDSAGTCELAYQAFTRSHATDDTTRGNALENVLGVPGNEMAVVDNVSLTILELILLVRR